MKHVAALASGAPRHLLDDMHSCGGWALSTYDRCEFRCVYCITGVQGTSTPRFSKELLPERLDAELAALAPEALIAVGALCDAYPDVERRFEVTRAALEVLTAQQRRIRIITKGTTVLRDVDLLSSYPHGTVTISLCSTNEEALRRVDPRAPSARERLSLVHALADSGVDVEVSAAPWIPGVSDAEALIDAVGDVPIAFAVLNVRDDHVAGTAFGRRFVQSDLNDAYLRERTRVGERDRVTWLYPAGDAVPTRPMKRLPLLLLDESVNASRRVAEPAPIY